MTCEAAKRILHPDTTREALAEIEFLGGFKGKEKLREAVDEACLMACEALDKQIPKTPLDIRAYPNEAKFADCPVCGQVVDEWSPYCDQCGQAIDWSKNYGKT